MVTVARLKSSGIADSSTTSTDAAHARRNIVELLPSSLRHFFLGILAEPLDDIGHMAFEPILFVFLHLLELLEPLDFRGGKRLLRLELGETAGNAVPFVRRRGQRLLEICEEGLLIFGTHEVLSIRGEPSGSPLRHRGWVQGLLLRPCRTSVDLLGWLAQERGIF